MPPRKPKTDVAAPAAGNGKTAAQLEQLAEAPATPPAEDAAQVVLDERDEKAAARNRILLDPDKLNMGDMARARKMLTALDPDSAPLPWSGSDPWELLAGPYEERNILIIWCVRTRTDPTFTLAQALAVDFGDLDLPETEGSPPPPGPELTSNGSGPAGTP